MVQLSVDGSVGDAADCWTHHQKMGEILNHSYVAAVSIHDRS